MTGIGIITNPHSKLNKRNPSRSALLGFILGKKGVIETTNSLEHLAQVAHKFKEQEIEVLAINGGDGTISRTITAFINAYGETRLPKIALLRGGTMNVLAGHLGIRGTPESLLYNLIQLDSKEMVLPSVPIRILNIEGNYGFIYADGTNAKILEEYYIHKRGTLDALWLALRLIFSFLLKGDFYNRLVVPRETAIHPLGQSQFIHQSLGIFASTITNLPLGLPLLRGDKFGNHQFQILSVTSPPEKLLWNLPAIMLLGKEGKTRGKFRIICEKASISNSTLQPYTLDGELFTPKDNTIHICLDREVEFILL